MVQASSIDNFLATIGINANIAPDTSATVISQLQYLGIDQVRAQAPTSTSAAAAFSTIGSAGIKFDLITTYWELPITPTLLNTMFSYIDTIAPFVQSIEGPNEVQNDPDTYEGLTGQAEWTALQETLYQLVQDDPNLTNAQKTTEVLSFSNVPGGTYTSPLSSTDIANVHAYGQPGILPYNVVNPTLGVTTIAPGKPIIISESGQTTVPTSQGVSEQEQALYDTDLFFDDYQSGIIKTYLYNLEDFNNGPTDMNFSGWYGLYNSDGTIKQAGIAIHNLTTILADPGSNATQSAGSLAYTLAGLPGDGHQLLLQKSNGIFDLVVWAENDGQYNTSTGTLNFEAPASVTLSLGGVQDVSVFDPIIGSSAVQNLGAVASVALELGSDPLIVQIGPDATAAPGPAASSPPVQTIGSGPDVLALQMSEDAYLGDAQFTITVDGKQVGGTLTVTALHDVGQSQTLDVLGSFAPGANTVAVNFLNDRWQPGVGDRNLYVTGAAINGTAVANSTLNLYSGGSQSMLFMNGPATSSTPNLSVGSGSSALTLGVSENAYEGDAKFTVSIDGNQIGGTLTTTANHAAGQSQLLNVLGTFTPGEHALALDFLNDAYTAGVGGGDRNLYLDSAAGADATFKSNSLALYSNGYQTTNFTIASHTA